MNELIEKAYKEKRIGKRQKGALIRHAEKHSDEQIQHMLIAMKHTTFRAAHKQAIEAVDR